MRTLSIKVDEALHRRLRIRASGANLSMSEFVRPLIEEAAYPGNRYVHSSQDELLSVTIQSFAILAALAAHISPQMAERGMADARHLLRERGLLDPAKDPLAQVGRVDVGTGDAQ
ncbi:MAG: CopG family transcriptional regulator [Pseudomonadota bacterium]